MNAEKNRESLEKSDCISLLRRVSKELVEVLLDISEENLEKQQVCEIPNQTSWDEAIQGWAQCSPFSCLFTAQQRSKKVKPESPASHCVLCTNLKDLNLSENVSPSHRALEVSYKTSKEHSRSSFPESLNRIPSTITSTSPLEEKISDITLSVQKNLLGNNLLFGPDQYTPDKLLSRFPQSDTTYLFLEDRNAGKPVLPSRLMVLPPVKVPPNPKNSHNPKRREGSGDTRPVIVSEKAAVERETPFPYSRPTSQGTVPIIQTQCQYHLLSDLNNSRRYQSPNHVAAETLPSAPSILERNVRQDEPITASVQPKSGQGSRLGPRENNRRRSEVQLPMLLGTRIPVSMQRLL